MSDQAAAETATAGGVAVPKLVEKLKEEASPSPSPSPRLGRADGELFPNIWSADFLSFTFNDRAYGWQLDSARMSSGRTSAISCSLRQINVRTL